MKRAAAWIAALLLGGCAADGTIAPVAATATSSEPADSCKAEVARLQARLAAETAERQKLARAAKGREEELRRQLDAMKSIERGILDRDEGKRTVTR